MNNLDMLPQWMIAIYIFAIGLCGGSFLNVVILRGLSGEDIVLARSKCPKCNNKLKWYMNIPVLSYIFLGGKCAYCKEKISIQYPVIEMLSGLLILAIYFTFGLTLKTLFLSIITLNLIALAMTDILETVIITNHTIFLTVVGILYTILKLSDISITESILAGICGFIGLEIISRIGYLLAKMRIFGEGDSYIMLGLGTIFGFKAILIIFILSILIQSIIALPLIAFNSFKQGKIKLGISYILTGICVILTYFINNFEFSRYRWQLIASLTTIAVTLYCLFNILKELKHKSKQFENILDENNEEDFEKGKDTFLLLPFGPALIISSIICIFYLGYIKTIIKTLFI